MTIRKATWIAVLLAAAATVMAGEAASGESMPQIRLMSSAGQGMIVPGSRVTLVIDIQARPTLHIYAPGAMRYLPIEWQMADSKSWTSFPVAYPASRMLSVPAINESVPVYDGHFRLMRNIGIGQETELASVLNPDRSFTVEGSLRYQACDDKECFLPKTLRLRWRFKAGKLEAPKAPQDPPQKPN